jgi:hypothetical protein
MECGGRVDEVVRRVDAELTACFHEDPNGDLRPWVCISCDGYVKKENKRVITVKRLKIEEELFKPQRKLPEEVKSHYTYSGEGKEAFMKKLLLSPVGCYVKECNGFCICSKCNNSTLKHETPLRAIANGFEIGPCAKELEVLNDVELAFISPVRVHGNIFSFYGGVKGVKGWHSFLKVDLKTVRTGLRRLEDMGDAVPNLIAVVMSGQFTKEARARTMKKLSLRREEARTAFNWMNENNAHFVKENIGQDFDNLPDPILVDTSEEVEDRGDNIQEVDEFTVAFPDNTLEDLNGGQQNIEEYKKVVKKVKDSNGDFFVLSAGSEYLRDFRDNNLSKAFPMQFSYGLGGPSDKRRRFVDLSDYLSHIINLSQPRFATQLFGLVCYNMLQRHRMLISATWRMKQKEEICTKFSILTPAQVEHTVLGKTAGHRVGTRESVEFVNMVDAISKKVPHTNQASRSGRNSVLAMQCNFGFPSVFFTVTYSDDNSFLIEVMANGKRAKTDSISIPEIIRLEEEDIKANVKKRKATRVKYPGLCALNYEMLTDIIIKCLIGWDETKGASSENYGLFGTAEAYFLATEEQSRKTLHAHFLIWLKHYTSLLKDLLSSDRFARKKAQDTLKSLVENVLSTKLIGRGKNSGIKNSHVCKTRKGANTMPEPVSDEGLRILRHKDGCRDVSGCIACCIKCGERFSNEDMILNFLLSRFPDFKDKIESLKQQDIGILDQIIYEHRHPNSEHKMPEEIVQAVYNLHTQYHVKQCFKYDDECRYDLPQPPRRETQIQVEAEGVSWLSWKGEKSVMDILRVDPIRGEYDVYVNTYCPAISKSKLACNSNIRFLFGGSDAFYATKYSTKDTQKEDTEGFDEVVALTRKRMIKQLFESPFSESMSRLIGATIVHNSKNVISAPMASYLSRNNSRFKMSHTLYFVPLRDIKEYLDGKELPKIIRIGFKLNYLRRTLLTIYIDLQS